MLRYLLSKSILLLNNMFSSKLIVQSNLPKINQGVRL